MYMLGKARIYNIIPSGTRQRCSMTHDTILLYILTSIRTRSRTPLSSEPIHKLIRPVPKLDRADWVAFRPCLCQYSEVTLIAGLGCSNLPVKVRWTAGFLQIPAELGEVVMRSLCDGRIDL